MGWAEKSVSIILRKHTNISKENDQLIKSHPDSSQNTLRNVPKVTLCRRVSLAKGDASCNSCVTSPLTFIVLHCWLTSCSYLTPKCLYSSQTVLLWSFWITIISARTSPAMLGQTRWNFCGDFLDVPKGWRDGCIPVCVHFFFEPDDLQFSLWEAIQVHLIQRKLFSFWTELLQWGLGQSSQLPLSTCLFRWHPQEFHSRGPDLGQPSQVPHPTCYLSWHPQECNLRESLTWVSLALLYCTSGVRPAGRRQLQRIVLASKILIEGGQDDEGHPVGLGDHLRHCWGREDQEGYWWMRQDHCCP